LQKFIWYTDFVAFSTRGDNRDYSIKIYLSDELTVHPDMERAILLPFKVPLEGTLLVSGSYGDTSPFQLPAGDYKLLFETRFLTDKEMAVSNRYSDWLKELRKDELGFGKEQKPELCLFTFIPTTEEVVPEIIKGFEPRQKLVLYDQPRPEGFN
jgi:hypothetical protein